MKTIATVMQLTRSLLILTPAEYDKEEGGLQVKTRRGSSHMPTSFGVPQIFELNDSLKEHPYEKTEELATFVRRCAESINMEVGDLFVCIEDEDVLITKEYKHPISKPKLLQTFAHVEAENLLHAEVNKYTILNFEYGQQYGKSNKSEDVSASLFAMNTGILEDIRLNFSRENLNVVKIAPPIAGMLYTSKADLNSATRAIALISMDFAATRLVVLHNGAPIFQQSFSSILEDIAEMFSLEFGISKLGAIDLIRKEGLGICNRCNSAQVRKQVMTMLDNAAGEVLRNLRMVISTQRLDIDTIVLCDVLAKLPNIEKYCRSVGLTAPMEKVSSLFTSTSSTPPVTTPNAAEKGYDSSSFITFNGLLTMPSGEANLISGESNIAAVIAAQGSSKIGKVITGVIGAAAAVWMVAVGGIWLALEVRQTNETNQINDTKYDNAKRLIAEEAEYETKLTNLELDLQTLPVTKLKSKDVVSELFTQVVDKTQHYAGWTITKTTNVNNGESKENISISTSIQVKDFDEYDELRKAIDEAGYFDVMEGFAVSTVIKDGQVQDGPNIQKYVEGNLELKVSQETIAVAEAEWESSQTESEGQTAATNQSDKENSTAESSAS